MVFSTVMFLGAMNCCGTILVMSWGTISLTCVPLPKVSFPPAYLLLPGSQLSSGNVHH
jgi:hypothetical protein